MIGKLDIIIANNSDTKTVNVPFKDTEPVYYIIERIRSKLGTKQDTLSRQELYINGKLIEDQQKSIGYYRIFGRTLTYRALDTIKSAMYRRTDTDLVHTSPDCHRLFHISNIGAVVEPLKGFSPETQRLFADEQIERTESHAWHSIGLVALAAPLALALRGGGAAYNVGTAAWICETAAWIGRTVASTGKTAAIPLNYSGAIGGAIIGDAVTWIGGTLFSDVSVASNVHKVDFSTSAPPGRVAAPGTNVECECACTPSHRVICIKTFGSLELPDTTFVCPNCNLHDMIVPVTVGFMSCKYRFHGIKRTGEQYTSDWVDVKDHDGYQLFDADKSTVWRRLAIESADLHACEDCTICLKPMESTDTLGCGHCFHTDCIANWTGPCPNCEFNKHLNTGFS
ncbi:hypothetical protein BGZ47_006951 [Haplosporangium gracile]|nr:hypothetical protein BGZ47_006951 [Haplosporangium gracile]